jgi:hypothetical protein
MPSGVLREFVVGELLQVDSGLDRAQLEKMSDEELVEQAKQKLSPLRLLKLTSLDSIFGKLPDLNLSSVKIGSSAPYSKGSSDQGMLARRR